MEKGKLGDLALAYWRLNNWVENVHVERKTGAISSLKQMERYLKSNDVELLDFLGQKYDSGYAIDVLDTDAPEGVPEENLIISETLCPLIMQRGEILKYGQVILGEKVKEVAANEELPPDPEKAITILTTGIAGYIHAPYRNKKLLHKMKWCLRKLTNQLEHIKKEKKEAEEAQRKGMQYEKILRLWH